MPKTKKNYLYFEIIDQINENQNGVTGQRVISIEHGQIREQFTDIARETQNRNNHNLRHGSGAPTRWPDNTNKVNLEGKHDAKTPMILEEQYEQNIEEYEDDYDNEEYEDNRIEYELKKKLLGKVRNDRGPISDEEMLVMQANSLPSEGIASNPEDLQTDKMQINPEKLAYILIGVCCGLSLLCLIVVAVSIGYKSETHYRLEDDSSGLNCLAFSFS